MSETSLLARVRTKGITQIQRQFSVAVSLTPLMIQVN